MRQPPGKGDILEIIEIDVIDADPAAFGDSSGTHAPARQRRPRPRWLVPVALAACTGAAVGLFVWQPWDVPPQWRAFESPIPTTATISNLLLPATPPGYVLSVVEPDSVGTNTPTTAPGYVLAEPGATLGFRRAARFEATPTGASDAAPATEQEAAEGPTVHGVPATLDTFRLRNELEWGPLGGHTWRVFTTGLTDDETLAFAAAVGAPSGAAALEHDYRLDGMVPLGSVSAFNSAYALRNELTGGHMSSELSPTVITYALEDDSELRVASVPAPPDAMQLVGYVFGSTSTAITVHGLPAQLIRSREAGQMVIWLEGGRLITVAGPLDDASLRAIAESVAPVNADEWLNAVNSVLSYYISVNEGVGAAPIDVGSGVTSTGMAWRVAITMGNPMVTCVYFGDNASTSITITGDVVDAESGTSVNIDSGGDSQSMCTFSTPRVPATREFFGAFPGLRFVVAIVPIEEYRLVLRVTSADGTLTDYEPVRLNDDFTGVAVAIADDATYSLVDPSA